VVDFSGLDVFLDELSDFSPSRSASAALLGPFLVAEIGKSCVSIKDVVHLLASLLFSSFLPLLLLLFCLLSLLLLLLCVLLLLLLLVVIQELH
jgi:hypothetical protein